MFIDTPPPAVRHQVIARLGGEHIAHAIHRRGAGGSRIVAWGDRILEWPLDGARAPMEVVPPVPGTGYSNGGCAVDLDVDGVEEIVLARGHGRWARDPELLWFRAAPGRQTWEEHRVARIPTEAQDSPHDILPLSLKSAGGRMIRGIVVLVSRKRLVWYQVPDNPREPWARHEIGRFPANASQSGLAIGNIAGHGRPDLVCGMFWAECPADPVRQPWTIRRFGDWDTNRWGGMAKLVLADLDGDGRQEIVASEAEIPDARLGIFQRDPAHPEGLWKCHLIDQGLYCPHSLLSVDLGQEGRPDLIVGEMTAGGWDFPLHPNPRILLYQNRGHLKFQRHTLVEGWGVHEMAVAPARPDGQLRIFAADETQTQKFPQMQTHVSSWTITPRAGTGGTR